MLVRRWLWSLAGCALILVGIVLAFWGLILLLLRDEGPNAPRLLPFWIGGSVILGALAIVLAGLWLLGRKGFGQRPAKPS